MRFRPEAADGGNQGLGIARAVLEPIKREYPGISYSDLWTLAGVTAIETMGGPQVPWRPGRSDTTDRSRCVTGKLPNASLDAKHLREVFYRMGFNDQEIVALSGAHCLGRCHEDRSGFDGLWTNAPTTFSNLFFKELLERKWTERKWNGPRQFQDQTGQLMMLPTDLALIEDPAFKKYVDLYAKDQKKFFEDFSAAFNKLLELGVPFGKH
jgi:cytochrome c peroxidase